MTSIITRNVVLPGDKRQLLAAAAAVLACVVTTPASAQNRSEPGPYAVARAGVQLDSDIKFPKQPQQPATKPGAKPAAPIPATTPPGFSRNIDDKAGFTGELGAGYDFGGFRLEGTVGYNTAAVNGAKLGDRSNFADGRLKSLDLGVSGYVDLNPGGRLNPFVGGGIGASRVSLDVSRNANATVPATPAPRRAGTQLNGRDWGFHWHADAGIGYALTPKTTLEIAGRYAQTSALDFKGRTVTVTGTGATAVPTATTAMYKPKTSSTSLMIGLRQKF